MRPFDRLRVGDAFVSDEREITGSDVAGFGELAGERVDPGGAVANEIMSACLTIGLVPNDYVVALRRIRELSFDSAVRAGDRIRMHGEIAELRPLSDAAGLVTGHWRVSDQEGRTVSEMLIEVLWRRDYL